MRESVKNRRNSENVYHLAKMEPEDNIEEKIEELRTILESMGLPSDYENPDYCIYKVAVFCAAGYVTLLWILLSTE